MESQLILSENQTIHLGEIYILLKRNADDKTDDFSSIPRTERNNDKLKDPFHCALFLADCFADLLSATDTQQKLSEAISRYQLQQLKERILQGRKPTEPTQKPVGA